MSIQEMRVRIFEELSKIVDPEINVSIMELQLVDNVEIKDGNVKVELHLTSPFCPAVFGFKIAQDIRDNLKRIDGV
ncbi:MAG: iron-sulfur cluster assembly protein, partial [Candidatus Nitrosocaldus sp.]